MLAGSQTLNAMPFFTVQEGIFRPVFGYVGCHVTPHLSVQAGYMQRHQQQQLDFDGTNAAGQFFYYRQLDQYFNAAVPVLLRFRLARRPVHRLHLDALLGATALLYRFHTENYTTVVGQVPNPASNQFNFRGTHWYLTGGLSLGFALAPHIELTAEATNNWYLNPSDDYRWGWQPGAGIGLRYHFNLRKEG